MSPALTYWRRKPEPIEARRTDDSTVFVPLRRDDIDALLGGILTETARDALTYAVDRDGPTRPDAP